MGVLIRGLSSDPSRSFSIVLQPEFNTGQRRTLGHSFHVNCQPKMEDIISWLTPLIDNFETQSGDGLGPLSLRTYVSVTDITGIPEPEAFPLTSSPINVAHIKEARAETKRAVDRTRKAAPTMTAIQNLESTLTTQLNSGFKEVVQAIKTLPSPNPTPPSLSYYGIPMVSIYSSPFLDQLMEHIQAILSHSSHPEPYFNFILEVLLKNGSVKTVGKGFSIASYTDLSKIRELLEGYIENFETQSGTPEERQPEVVVSSLIKVMDRSNAPAVDWTNPLATPKAFKESNASPVSKRTSPKATQEKLAILNSQLHEGFKNLQSSQVESTNRLIEAVKSIPTQSPLISNVNWTPILHGITKYSFPASFSK